MRVELIPREEGKSLCLLYCGPCALTYVRNRGYKVRKSCTIMLTRFNIHGHIYKVKPDIYIGVDNLSDLSLFIHTILIWDLFQYPQLLKRYCQQLSRIAQLL